MYKWERINAGFSYMKIPSGWLLKINETFAFKGEALQPARVLNGNMAVVYVPDAKHEIVFDFKDEAKI